MPALLLALLPSLVPVLVNHVEGLFGPKSGPQKKEWVHEMVQDLLKPFLGKLPLWAQPVANDVLPLVDALIEKAVSELNKAKQQ